MKDSIYSVLIIEDDKEIGQMIKLALNEKNYKVEIAHDGYIGLKMANENTYDAIILDLNLPMINGYDVCRGIRMSNSNVQILMVTAYGTIENKLAGFDVGADDYITKPFEIKELLARLNVAIKRRSISQPDKSIIQIADLEVNLKDKTVTRSGNVISLTAKEFFLLEYLIKNKGRIVSKAEIAENIWDITFDTGTNIIEVYVNYLRKKIDKNYSPNLIHTIIGMGYVIREEDV